MNDYEKTPEQLAECCRKQDELCKAKAYPHFAPHDGNCYNCRKNVYQNYDMGDRIRYGYPGEVLVTGCPHCNRSYCD